MPYTLHETGIPDLKLLEPAVFGDSRGFFKELYNAQQFTDLGLRTDWVQDNLSRSRRGALRGLHFQAPPHAQAKLVTVLEGQVVDIVVDVRTSSPTYGQSCRVELTAENHRMLYVPEGFAHGFAVLSESCLFYYKCAGLYNKASEGGLRWNDPELALDWGLPESEAIISEKDQVLPLWQEFKSPF